MQRQQIPLGPCGSWVSRVFKVVGYFIFCHPAGLDLALSSRPAPSISIHFCITHLDAFFTNAESVGTG
jgi:hypothetical protein